MGLLNGHTTYPDAQWFPEAELGLFLHWGMALGRVRQIAERVSQKQIN